jgi:Flp pilus assembly pilin Flp
MSEGGKPQRPAIAMHTLHNKSKEELQAANAETSVVLTLISVVTIIVEMKCVRDYSGLFHQVLALVSRRGRS